MYAITADGHNFLLGDELSWFNKNFLV
jgi:hypothetical protein